MYIGVYLGCDKPKNIEEWESFVKSFKQELSRAIAKAYLHNPFAAKAELRRRAFHAISADLATIKDVSRYKLIKHLRFADCLPVHITRKAINDLILRGYLIQENRMIRKSVDTEQRYKLLTAGREIDYDIDLDTMEIRFESTLRYLAKSLISYGEIHSYDELRFLSPCLYSLRMFEEALFFFYKKGYLDILPGEDGYPEYVQMNKDADTRNVIYRNYIAAQEPSSRYYFLARDKLRDCEKKRYTDREIEDIKGWIRTAYSAEGGKELVSGPVMSAFMRLQNDINNIYHKLGRSERWTGEIC